MRRSNPQASVGDKRDEGKIPKKRGIRRAYDKISQTNKEIQKIVMDDKVASGDASVIVLKLVKYKDQYKTIDDYESLRVCFFVYVNLFP